MGLWVVVHPHISGFREPSMPTPSEDYRTIPLSKGQTAIVSSSDYEWLNQWTWYAQWNPKTRTFYAVCFVNAGGKKIKTYMHRFILGLQNGDKRQGDHDNHDTLDNRRSNLRVATHAQNQHNKFVSRDNLSGLKGVSFHKKSGLWFSRIMCNRIPRHLGYFRTPEAAYGAYCAAEKEFFGEFARKE
jgi:hypothetical protein